MRLTHSCARNADLTSSGHAVWPSLLHRPLIRSVTASLILLQISLIVSFGSVDLSQTENALSIGGIYELKFNYQINLHIGGSGLNWTGDTGIFSPMLYRLSYRTIFTLPFYATTMILAGGTSPLHRTRNSRHNFEASGVRTLHLWWIVAASTFPF